MKAALFVLGATCLLTACAQEKAPPAPAAQPAAAAPAPTVIDDQLRAMQKARDVNKTMDQRSSDIDDKVKEGGG